MRDEPLKVGRVAISTMGRDAGRRFMVAQEVDEVYVTIVDGDLRKIAKPKKKKSKHLKSTRHVLTELRERLLNGEKVTDAEIRKALAAESMQKEGANVEI